MKLAPKILSLPIIVSLFLVALSGIVVVSLDKIEDNVKSVTRTLAPQANHATALLQNILDRNILVQRYLRTGQESLVEEFQIMQTQSGTIVSKLDEILESQDHTAYLQTIRDRDVSYSRTYLQDVVVQEQLVRNTAADLLLQKGPQVVQSLTDIIKSTSNEGGQDVIAAATDAVEAFQVARIFVSQYILNSNPKDASRVEMEFLAVNNAMYDLGQLVHDSRRLEFKRLAKQYFDEFSNDFETIFSAVNAKNNAVSGPMATESQAIIDAAIGLQNVVWKDLNNSGETVEQTIAKTRSTVTITTMIALILGLIPAIMVTRSIKRAIQKTVLVADRIANGDLDQEIQINSKDETGQLLGSLASMIENLTKVVNSIQSASGTVKSGASEISKGNLDISNRTSKQSANLEDTASSIEQMTQAVKQNAENAVQASKLAQDARARAERSSDVFGNAVAAMAEISESSQKISQIIGVIDEIAFQTNLLALNASVEAARAGDSGRGFAVVASEVRSLAGRSATAANEIKSLIVDSGQKVEDGTELVNSSRNSLGEIVSDVKKVSDVVNDIAAANQEQSSGIEAINRAIESMDALTQQNKSLVEEAASASQLLGDQADELNDLTTFFKSKQTAT